MAAGGGGGGRGGGGGGFRGGGGWWFPRRRRFMAVDSEAAVLRSTAAGSEAARVLRSVVAAFAPRRVFMAAAIATDIATSITGRTSTTGITSTGGSMAPAYYGYPYYYGYRHRYCRVIWTYYGPRKICRYRPWYRHHWRHYGYYGPLLVRAAEMKQAPDRAPVLVMRANAAAQSQSLPLPGLDLPRRQRLHPPLCPVIRRPVAETRGFLGRCRADRRCAAWTGATTGCVASLIISTNSGLSATAGSLAKSIFAR